jgi:hypothetical protein
MTVVVSNRRFLPSEPSSRKFAQRPRALGLAVAALLAGRLLYRLCLGRWPSAAEAQLFTAGLRDRDTPLPPCCRAMLNVPAAQVQLARMLLLDMVQRGVIAPAHPGQPIALPTQSGNPLTFWRGPSIAFLHLEKTAGTTLSTVLTDQFHPAQIDPDPDRTAAPHMAAPFARRPASTIRRHALIYGHYDLPALKRLDAGRIVITMLREPASRILSLYYFWRSIDLDSVRGDVSFGAVAMAHRCSLLDFLRCDIPSVRDHIDNLYVRRLTGFYGTGNAIDRVAEAPNQALSLALQGLQRIDFVGVTEEMERSLAALGAFLGFARPDAIPRENAAATNAATAGGVFSPVPRETLTPAHRRHLSQLTQLDDVVYRAARERLALYGGQCRPLHGKELIAGYFGAA